MKTRTLSGIMASLLLIFCISCEMPTPSNPLNPKDGGEIVKKKKRNRVKPGTPIPVTYPKTPQDSSVVDNYFGKDIPDPFRWLEDDRSEATSSWVKLQNEATYGYLDQIPYRDAIAERLTQLWDYEKYSAPFQKGEHFYYFKNSGLQNQSVLYGTDGLDGTPKEILDPNKFSNDGTASLAAYGFSKGGKYLAYGVSEGGSDWRTIHIKDLETGETLQDKVEWVKFSGISWYKDGFFYSRYPKPQSGDELKGQSKFHSMYYHKVGTPQSKDILVFADRRNAKINIYGNTTEDERFLVVSTSETTSNNKLYFRDLSKGEREFTPIVENLDNDYSVVGNVGENLYVRTNYKAPNYRLISINSRKPEPDFWEEIVPESEHVLEGVKMAGGKIVCRYIQDASSRLKVHSLTGEFLYNIALPGIGTVGGFSGRQDSQMGFYSFTSFTQPNTIFKFDFETEKTEVYRAPKIKGINPDEYVTKQVFYESRDGTKVPMFITHKRGMEMDGTNPTLLYGYGGFNISILPSFSLARMVHLENGGIYVVANIRGGGEYGRKWHDQGRLKNKQNVFDDFISAAEYLIENKYTTRKKLAIEGRSNGGLLVGACMTQRPDLFKVALPAVGVLDMFRYHEFTIGRAWATDYGLSTDSTQFHYLYNYSPLHNVSPASYPATLVTTADHDDRVVPAHSFKFISELQRKHQGENPVLIRVDVSAGHGAGKPTKMIIDEVADKIAFTWYNLGEDVAYDY